MLFRTPVTPIVAGSALDVAGGRLAEPLLAVLFAGSVVAWAAAARAYGARAAILVAVALLVYPAYGLMFHELSSEPLFAAAFALWAWLVVRAASRPSARRFLIVGLAVALLALIRPGNAVLLAFAVFPFVLPGDWRARTKWAGAFLVAAVVPLAAWAVLNGVRFGDYTLARGGNAVIPFYRAFISDKIVSPDNGPESRKLAAAIRRDLLTRDPYKAYGVTLHKVFTSGSFRIHEDLYLLSDQVFGWNSDYSVLRGAGWEAVRAHPSKYASGVLHTVWHQLAKSYFRTPPAGSRADHRHDGRPAAADRGRADPCGPERLDLAARQQHPRRLDVGDAPSLRVQQAVTAPSLRRDRARARLALSSPARPEGQRPASPPPEPAVALVPAPDPLDPARLSSPRVAPPKGSADADCPLSRRAARDRLQRPGSLRRPTFRPTRRSRIRALRGRSTSGNSRSGTCGDVSRVSSAWREPHLSSSSPHRGAARPGSSTD